MDLNAESIMSSPLIAARPDMTVRELVELLRERHISGAPVVDAAEHLVGVISLTDLVALSVDSRDAVKAAESDFHTSPAMDRLAEAEGLLLPDEAVFDDPVCEIMSPHAVTAGVDATVGELADLMITRGVHRVIILRDGCAVGIVSVRDILNKLRAWDTVTR